MPAESKTIEVLITGFDPVPGWEHLPLNPSAQAAKIHNLTMMRKPPPLVGRHTGIAAPMSYDQQVMVHITYKSIPASYPAFTRFIPQLHFGGKYDAFVHVGGANRATAIELEKHARRVGFQNMYPDGLYPELVCPELGDRGHGLPEGEENAEGVYLPNMDVDAMRDFLQKDMGVKVRCSDDSGLQGCEYVHACSMRAAEQYALKHQEPVKPVIFSPPLIEHKEPNAIYTGDQTAEVLKACCWYMGSLAASHARAK